MYNSDQKGRSFLATIGVMAFAIAIIAVVIFWSLQIIHYKKINEIVTTTSDFFQKFQDNAKELVRQKAQLNTPASLKNYGLIDDCKEIPSMFSRQKYVCKLPLGEMDVSTQFDDPYLYTYVYVHFNDMYKRRSCEQFLGVAWQDILPAYLWGQNGYIGVLSENTKGKIYFSNNEKYIQDDGAMKKPTPEHTKAVCKLCTKSRYCSIQFTFELADESQKVTFPSEFVGENEEEGKEGENEGEEEVSQDGNTYTKTDGDFKEVVTYSSNGTFSGGTFSGGAFRSAYEGTYSPSGITSYTSYSDINKTNISKKIDNITYDSKGNVLSYEKDAKKVYLIGNADDCLIMDDENNARKFAHCEKLFAEETSSLTLNYDSQGRLSEVLSEGAEDASYSFVYDDLTGELVSYCQKDKGCSQVTDKDKIKDILKQDIPTTIGQFNTLYKTNIEMGTVTEKPAKPKHRILTREEALKYTKESGNKVKVTFK